MKRRKRLPIPQHEFGFVPEMFRLVGDTADDGERITREQAEAQQARRQAEAAQSAFIGLMPDED